jgi:hypothetical protein
VGKYEGGGDACAWTVAPRAFGLSQLWSEDNGTVPPRVFGQRSIAAAAVVSLGFDSALVIVTFYLRSGTKPSKGSQLSVRELGCCRTS